MIRTLPGLPHLRPGAIYCIGRNYAEHAKELNNPVPTTPIIFMKPACSLLEDGGTVMLPSGSTNVHHEAEVVVVIGKEGKNISREDAFTYIEGYAIGIDVTARDIQDSLKSTGKPWLLAKGLDTFAPLGNVVSVSDVENPVSISIKLWVNDQLRQDGNTKDMIFPIDDIIARLSQHFTLLPGDLIYTGTPEGVGPMNHGDTVRATLNNGISSVNVTVSKS